MNTNNTGTHDHVVTLVLSVLSSLAILLVVAVLARSLDMRQFYQFTITNRYLGFFAIAGNLGVAFAFIKFSVTDSEKQNLVLANTCKFCIFICVFLLTPIWVIFVSTQKVEFSLSGISLFLYLCTFVWVLSQSWFHISAPYSRHRGGTTLYSRFYVGAKLVAPLIGCVLVVLSGQFEFYFLAFGATSLFFQWYLWRTNDERPHWNTAASILKFGSSRWLESMLRAALPTVFVLVTQYYLGTNAAGSVAIIYTIVKSLESVIQPVVVSVMMRGQAGGSVEGPDRLRKTLVGCAAIVILGGLVTALTRDLIPLLIVVLLGDSYLHIGRETWVVMFGVGPIIALSLSRALYDNGFNNSPMMVINAICIVLAVLTIGFAKNVWDIALLIVLIQNLRFLMYIVSIAALRNKIPGSK